VSTAGASSIPTSSAEEERADDASLIEIFASAQGEGPEVGRSTVFVRFGGCDLRCRWCDSPTTWRTHSSYRVETEAGRGVFSEHLNPISVASLAEIAIGLAPRAATWISLTGGEPLLQPDAIASLSARLAERGRRVYLETHGLHADALEKCVEQVDLVSMDWKLTSDVVWGPGQSTKRGQDFHDAHEAFLRIAMRAGGVYVKVVLTPNTQDAELDEMIGRIVRVSPDIPLVLQPVTPMGGVKAIPDSDQLLVWLARAEERLTDVRLIPQTHPIYGVL
jgi:7-carboxy-7-deazaguanine synthase